MTYILQSSDFNLFLQDYLMTECCSILVEYGTNLDFIVILVQDYLWSSDFALYLQDNLIKKHDTSDNCS